MWSNLNIINVPEEVVHSGHICIFFNSLLTNDYNQFLFTKFIKTNILFVCVLTLTASESITIWIREHALYQHLKCTECLNSYLFSFKHKLKPQNLSDVVVILVFQACL